jgi:hypothetical protein
MSANELASLVGGWAALTTSMMLLLGTIFGVYQLRIAAKARRLQALASIYQQLRPREVVEIEQDLLHHPSDQINIQELTDNDIRKINTVVYSYQRLGYFLYQGLVTESEILPMVGWESILLWEKLKEFVRTQVREDVPHARAHFEYLASKTSDYIKKNPKIVIPNIIGFDADIDELRSAISSKS